MSLFETLFRVPSVKVLLRALARVPSRVLPVAGPFLVCFFLIAGCGSEGDGVGLDSERDVSGNKAGLEDASGVGVAAPDPATMLPARQNVLEFAFVGDMMIGSDFSPARIPPADGAETFTEVRHLLQSPDVTIGNLEGPLTRATSSKCAPGSTSCYAFRMPPRYIEHFKSAGFDVLNVANNHANDMGAAGAVETIKTIEEAGLLAYGRKGRHARFEVDGVSIAILGFAPYAHSNDLLNIAKAEALVAEAEEDADIVIVTFHGGDEGPAAQHTPDRMEILHGTGEQRGNLVAFSRAVIEAGADLVVGHGPHVLRGMQFHENVLVAYSLANFSTYGFSTRGALQWSTVLQVRLDQTGSFVSGVLHPVRLVGGGVPSLDPTGEAVRMVRRLSEEDFGSAAVHLQDDGTLLPPQ